MCEPLAPLPPGRSPSPSCRAAGPYKNNLAERRIRPIVTARKVCFCSQSEKGLKTREALMTVIDTLSLRNEDVVAKLIDVLNELRRDPERNVSDLLWG